MQKHSAPFISVMPRDPLLLMLFMLIIKITISSIFDLFKEHLFSTYSLAKLLLDNLLSESLLLDRSKSQSL